MARPWLDHFMITLNSDVDSPRHTTNDASVFTVPLQEELDFNPAHTWEVALQEVFFPRTFKILEGETCKIGLSKKVQVLNTTDYDPSQPDTRFKTILVSQHFSIPEGNYDPYTVCSKINMGLRKLKFEADEPTPEGDIKRQRLMVESNVRFLHHENVILISRGKGERLHIHESLRYMLGFNRHKDKSNVFVDIGPRRMMKLSNCPSFDIHLQNMFIYMDIVEYSQMSNFSAPLLRIVHLGTTIKQMINVVTAKYHVADSREFRHFQFHRVRVHHVKEITVKMCDSLGDPINFHGGKTVLNLLFVRRK